MISMVTASTVATATTAGSFVLVCILLLLVLLIQKEITSAAESRFARALGRTLNIGIVPLVIGFGLVVALKIAETLK